MRGIATWVVSAAMLGTTACGDDDRPRIDSGLDAGSTSRDGALDAPRERPDAGPCTPTEATGTWERVAGPSAAALVALSDDDVWASGYAYLAHWDGTRWTEQPDAAQLFSMSATATDDVWALDAPFAQAYRWNGSEWSAAMYVGCSASSIAAVARDEVWVSCTDGQMARFDGSAWTLASTTLAPAAGPMFALAPNDVWAGSISAAHHFDGTAWTTHDVGASVQIRGVWGCASDDVWAVGSGGTIVRWRGTSWTTVESGTENDLNAVAGSSCTDVWAVGRGGTILHWDGGAWTMGPSITGQDLRSIAITPSGVVWVGGNYGTLLRADAGSFTVVRAGGLTERTISDVFGADGTLYMAHDGDVLAWDGTRFEAVVTGAGGNPLREIHGTGSDNVWVVGGPIVRKDGDAWTVSSVPFVGGAYGAHAVWTAGRDDTWIAGFNGFSTQLMHWDGTEWAATESMPTGALWGFASDEVWGVGDGTRRWNGSEWSEVPIESGVDLRALWGRAPNDLWAVGAGGVAARFDGTGWWTESTGTSADLVDVWGSSAGEVLAVGTGGTIARWSCEWSSMDSGTVIDLHGVWLGEDGSAWAVGSLGTVLRYTP